MLGCSSVDLVSVHFLVVPLLVVARIPLSVAVTCQSLDEYVTRIRIRYRAASAHRPKRANAHPECKDTNPKCTLRIEYGASAHRAKCTNTNPSVQMLILSVSARQAAGGGGDGRYAERSASGGRLAPVHVRD